MIYLTLYISECLKKLQKVSCHLLALLRVNPTSFGIQGSLEPPVPEMWGSFCFSGNLCLFTKMFGTFFLCPKEALYEKILHPFLFCAYKMLACVAGARKGKGEGKIGRARNTQSEMHTCALMGTYCNMCSMEKRHVLCNN